MKIKPLAILAIIISTIIFAACSDDLSNLGSNIQPDGDGITAGSATVDITAETKSFKDSVYARTIYGMLGEYEDPIFGKIKSDYLCEFYFPKDTIKPFKDRVVSVDSVFLNTGFIRFTGDSVSPMGLSVYEITSELKPFFFTSIDPKKYCDMTNMLGQSIFSIENVPDTIEKGFKVIVTELQKSLGQRLYQEWIDNPDTFGSSEMLKKFFKGVYVTTDFGTGSLISTEFTDMEVYYTYSRDNKPDTIDFLRLSVTPEVIQMNRIKNDFNNDLSQFNGNGKSYLKTPAGLYTELTIPLNEIIQKIGKDQTLNAANLVIKGLTEEEDKYNMERPNSILLINKDSLPNFFFNRRRQDNKTSFIISRTITETTSTIYNSYNFGNIASIINYYSKYYKDEPTMPDLKYLMIPVSIGYDPTSSTPTVQNVYNLMAPTSAILRTDPENMKMSIIYSKYNDNKN